MGFSKESPPRCGCEHDPIFLPASLPSSSWLLQALPHSGLCLSRPLLKPHPHTLTLLPSQLSADCHCFGEAFPDLGVVRALSLFCGHINQNHSRTGLCDLAEHSQTSALYLINDILGNGWGAITCVDLAVPGRGSQTFVAAHQSCPSLVRVYSQRNTDP